MKIIDAIIVFSDGRTQLKLQRTDYTEDDVEEVRRVGREAGRAQDDVFDTDVED